MSISEVSNHYKVSMYGEYHLCMLKHSRKITKAGEASHIYLPLEMEGEEVIGIVVK